MIAYLPGNAGNFVGKTGKYKKTLIFEKFRNRDTGFQTQDGTKANSAATELYITNINTKRGAISREIGLPLNRLLVYLQL